MTAKTYDDLRSQISTRHAALSKRLRQIAEFALHHPNDMALETVAVIADRAAVQPSTLIRFAKAFGFDGFSDMQRVFRTRLTERVPSYGDRIRALRRTAYPGGDDLATTAGVLRHFAEAGIHALEHLRDELSPADLEAAVDLLADAEIVHIMGQRRAFPVASYLAYSLSHLDRRICLIDGVGGLTSQQAQNMMAGDVLLTASFRPYSPDTVLVAELATERGVPVVAITDGPLSPLSPLAQVALEVEDAQIEAFRSLSASMCLSLSLVVALGQRLTGNGDG